MRSAGEPIRAVVDTNLIVSGVLNERRLPRQLLLTLRAGAFALVLSEPLYAEYGQVLPRRRLVERYGVTLTAIVDVLALLAGAAVWVTPVPDLPVAVRDPKDAMVLATALGGRADYLVTGDADLLALRNEPALGTLRIVTVREFLDVVQPPT